MAEGEFGEFQGRLLWLDLEMSGLSPQHDRILEIASLVTDGDLDILEEGPDLVIHQSEEIIKGMGDWCQEQHGRSGLTQRVRESVITQRQAEDKTLAFLDRWFPGIPATLAGNSIHHDRAFLMRHMPHLAERIHYRLVDVSSVKELVERWYPEVCAKKPVKSDAHRALEDVRQSLEELKYYRDAVFRKEA